MQFKSICFVIHIKQCFLPENDSGKSNWEWYERKIRWSIHNIQKYIISRWNLLWMPFDVYSPHVFNIIFVRVYRPWRCCLWPMNLTTLHLRSGQVYCYCLILLVVMRWDAWHEICQARATHSTRGRRPWVIWVARAWQISWHASHHMTTNNVTGFPIEISLSCFRQLVCTDIDALNGIT